MSNEKRWEVVIDGKVQSERFSEEEPANTWAGQRRNGPNQKIVVYELDSPRHQKAFDKKLTPTVPGTQPSKEDAKPSSEPPKETPKADAPPKDDQKPSGSKK